MLKNMYIILIILLMSVITVIAQDEEAEVQQVLIGRFRKLQNLIANYKVTTEWISEKDPKDAVRKVGDSIGVTSTGVRVTQREFSVLGNRCLRDERLVSWDRKIKDKEAERYLQMIPTTQRELNVYGPDRTEHLLVEKRTQRPANYRGEIRDRKDFPSDCSIGVALGLRQFDLHSLLTEEAVKKMTISRGDSGQVVLTNVDDKNITHEWIFDPKLGYGLTFYRMRVPPENYINIEFAMEDFRNVDGIVLPFKMNQRWMNSQEVTFRSDTFEVSDYRLNDPANTVERYHIDCPEGTTVFDTRSRIAFKVKGGEMAYVGDDRIYEMALDEVYKAQVNEPSNSAPSPDANKPDEVVKAIEEKSVDPTVDDIMPLAESEKSFSLFWKLAGGLVLAVIVVGFLAYRKRQMHPEG